MPASSADFFLSLTQAARELGVHPVTLRRWAERGDVLVIRTPGGHRRFPRSEINRMIALRSSNLTEGTVSSLEDSVLSHTRTEIAEHSNEEWMKHMNEEERAAQRQMGRRVMGRMMQYISVTDDSNDILQEAYHMGRTYADTAQRTGLSLSQTLQAMMFFRENVIESVVWAPDAGRARLLRRINTFLNTILLGVTESYE